VVVVAAVGVAAVLAATMVAAIYTVVVAEADLWQRPVVGLAAAVRKVRGRKDLRSLKNKAAMPTRPLITILVAAMGALGAVMAAEVQESQRIPSTSVRALK
jgi:hypothetical protein